MNSDPRRKDSSSEHVDSTLDEMLSKVSNTPQDDDLDLDLELSIPEPDMGASADVAADPAEREPAEPGAQPATGSEGLAHQDDLDGLDATTEEAGGEVDRVAQLQAELQSAQEEAAAERDKWMRAMAELENVRRRTRKELETTINLANADLIRELVEVADNFQRALDASKEPEDGPAAALKRGVTLIEDQFLEILKRNGLSRIECQGQPFDPNLHEAVSQIETDDVPSEHIVAVVQEGYLLNNVVLRPARVVVAA